jgi:hypothetical protein
MREWVKRFIPSGVRRDLRRALIVRKPYTGTSHLLPDSAVSFIKNSRIDTYLEYGAGESTKLALQIAHVVLSVENDREFLAGINNPGSAVFHPIYVNTGSTVQWGHPRFNRPTRRRVNRWKKYPQAPWDIMGHLGLVPDFILVDGRFRVACVLESLLRLPTKSGCQFLVDDFFDREESYSPMLEFVCDVQSHDRAVSFKPASDFSRDRC